MQANDSHCPMLFSIRCDLDLVRVFSGFATDKPLHPSSACGDERLDSLEIACRMQSSADNLCLSRCQGHLKHQRAVLHLSRHFSHDPGFWRLIHRVCIKNQDQEQKQHSSSSFLPSPTSFDHAQHQSPFGQEGTFPSGNQGVTSHHPRPLRIVSRLEIQYQHKLRIC
jgi:hypothetical protein